LAGLPELGRLDRIADSLALHGRTIVDDFFGAELTAALRVECRAACENGEFRAAAVGSGADRQVRSAIRGDQIQWMQQPAHSEPQRACQHRFEQLRLTLNQKLQLGLFEFESHFARYPAGAFYARHIDQFRGDSRRKLSCVLYLNEDWRAEDCGALRFYVNGEGAQFEDVLPQGGRLVVFLSEKFAHEVLPATRERLSIAGWFKTR
jgi:SM-20-related protein